MVKRLDKDDFTRLVLQNQTAMFRTARAIVSTDEDAEDAVLPLRSWMPCGTLQNSNRGSCGS